MSLTIPQASPVSSQLPMAWFLRLWQAGRRPILILGHGRSGTTWVGNVLATGRRVLYTFEPGSPTANQPFSNWFAYARPGQASPTLQQAFDPAFQGLPGRRNWQRAFIHRLIPGYQLIIKDVAGLMAAEWLQERYRPAMLLVIRHPCPTILSELAQGTDPLKSKATLLAQSQLFEDHLQPYRPVIEAATTPHEILAALWAARYRVIANALPRHPDWKIVYYERLCEEPVAAFHQLFSHFRLPWSDRNANFIWQSSTTTAPGLYSGKRVSRHQLDKWKEKLTPAEIAAIFRVIQPFQLPFYPR